MQPASHETGGAVSSWTNKAGGDPLLQTTGARQPMTNRSKNARIDGAVAELVVTGNVSNRADLHSYLSTKWEVS